MKLWSQVLDIREITHDIRQIGIGAVLTPEKECRTYSTAEDVRGFTLLNIFRRDPKLGNYARRILLE